jgi:hypothetical protein
MSDKPKNEESASAARPSRTGDSMQDEWAGLDGFDANRLMDGLIAKMNLQNDAALASRLQVILPIIQMIRNESLAMSPSMLFRWIHEATGIKAEELKELMKNSKSLP